MALRNTVGSPVEGENFFDRVQELRYQFVSKLLKDWWSGHYSFGFIPTAQRGERP
jgi:hypothetical protein